jgi:hypothetical protein
VGGLLQQLVVSVLAVVTDGRILQLLCLVVGCLRLRLKGRMAMRAGMVYSQVHRSKTRNTEDCGGQQRQLSMVQVAAGAASAASVVVVVVMVVVVVVV